MKHFFARSFWGFSFLLVAGLAAQSRAEKPNDLTLELGGKCLIYSLSYQRMIGRSAGLAAGRRDHFAYRSAGADIIDSWELT